MSETLYTYVRFRKPNGEEAYERVPSHLAENYPGRIKEPLVSMPRVAPQFKNGEGQYNSSVALDRILANTQAADARRAAEWAAEVAALRSKNEECRERSESSKRKGGPPRAYGRVVEP